MKLTPADKLALMLTSAGSQRKLAAYLGVSHQQVGRWLQGERVNPNTGAISNTPPPEAVRNIGAAFGQFATAVRSGARAQGLPHDPALPVAVGRLLLQFGPRAGKPGLRAVIEHTNHMRPELFASVIESLAASGAYYEVSVRSVVDLALYFKRAEERMQGKRRSERQEGWRRQMRHRIQHGVTAAPMWSKRQNIDPRAIEPWRAMRQLSEKLRQKHEPATTLPGTKLADQVVLSTFPEDYEPAKPKAKKSPRRSARKNIRGRGPK
jgi:transcriptional regulator with XRE-family HTH domain